MRGMSPRQRARPVAIGIGAVIALLSTAASATGQTPPPAAPPPAAEAPPVRPAFDGDPGWLVIGETTSDAREAAMKAGDRLALGIAVSPVRSDLFQGLRKGLFVLIYGGFADRARAAALATELGVKGIKVYVKNSGALATTAGARPRLLRVWGRLDETVRSPTPIEITGENDRPSDTVYTDRHGRYESWLLIDGANAKKPGRLELCAASPAYSAKASCTDAFGGWYDICGHADYGAGTRDVQVTWSPTPDCNGE